MPLVRIRPVPSDRKPVSNTDKKRPKPIQANVLTQVPTSSSGMGQGTP